MININYADIRRFDVTNGSGIGVSLFVSGCSFNCPNCFNKEAQDFNYNKPFTKEAEDKFIEYAKDKHVNHVSLLGGEIFQQDLDIILHLVKRIKEEVNKPIFIWTGYLWSDLLKDNKKVEILNYVDVVTDGRFEQNNKDLNLKFKGSSNQITISVQASLKQNKIIEHEWE